MIKKEWLWINRNKIKNKSMKPVGKYIIIKTITEEVKTSSGLLLSQSDVDDFRYRKGEVVKRFAPTAKPEAIAAAIEALI